MDQSQQQPSSQEGDSTGTHFRPAKIKTKSFDRFDPSSSVNKSNENSSFSNPFAFNNSRSNTKSDSNPSIINTSNLQTPISSPLLSKSSVSGREKNDYNASSSKGLSFNSYKLESNKKIGKSEDKKIGKFSDIKMSTNSSHSVLEPVVYIHINSNLT